MRYFSMIFSKFSCFQERMSVGKEIPENDHGRLKYLRIEQIFLISRQWWLLSQSAYTSS
jgi:hypothetical protein